MMCNFITATVKRSQRLSGSRVSTRKIFTRRSTPEILINMASMNHSLDHKSAHCEVPCTFICFTCMAVGGRVGWACCTRGYNLQRQTHKYFNDFFKADKSRNFYSHQILCYFNVLCCSSVANSLQSVHKTRLNVLPLLY